jgi:hypothetical protein
MRPDEVVGPEPYPWSVILKKKCRNRERRGSQWGYEAGSAEHWGCYTLHSKGLLDSKPLGPGVCCYTVSYLGRMVLWIYARFTPSW